MDFLFPFKESEIKPALKMSVQRIQIMKNKKTAHSKQAKREIATLLGQKKEEMARIRVEHIIRDDCNIEALEMIEMWCELVFERIQLISASKTCPLDLLPAVSSLIWSSTQIEIDELKDVSKQFKKKYGSKFVEAVNKDRHDVNPRLLKKLSIAPPGAQLVIGYLEAIAKEFGIEYTPSDYGLPTATEISGTAAGGGGGGGGGGLIPDLNKPFPAPIGYSVPMAPGSNLSEVYMTSAQAQVYYSVPLPTAQHNPNDPYDTYKQNSAVASNTYNFNGDNNGAGSNSSNMNNNSSNNNSSNTVNGNHSSSSSSSNNNYSNSSSSSSSSSSLNDHTKSSDPHSIDYQPSAPPPPVPSISNPEPSLEPNPNPNLNSLNSSGTSEKDPDGSDNDATSGGGGVADGGDDGFSLDDIQSRLDKIRFNK